MHAYANRYVHRHITSTPQVEEKGPQGFGSSVSHNETDDVVTPVSISTDTPFSLLSRRISSLEETFAIHSGAQGPQGPTICACEPDWGRHRGPRGFQGARGHWGDCGPRGCHGKRGVQGTQGQQGDAGVQGPQGDPGTQGDMGTQGFQGSQGMGAQGEQGNIGPQGNQGAQGSQGTGAQGEQGNIGPQGNQGAQGMQGTGPQGAQGGDGNRGPQGFQGTQGTGPQGAQGTNGNTGPQGFQGVQGMQGTGPQGTMGNQGDMGAQGFQGVQGMQGTGPQGTMGNQGDMGAQGFQGVQGMQGTGPQGVMGNQGVMGAQGFQGVQGGGPQGQQGPQGWQGTLGTQGAQGADGPQGTQGGLGFQGTQGSQGWQGFQGVQGPQGWQGFQGPQGWQGDQGFQGTQGSQGWQGFQGVQGPQGWQGFQGVQGPQGWQGFQGVQGPQGDQGPQGWQGFQGVQGPQGWQGFQGVQGLQGFQGVQGPQGWQGVQGPQGWQGVQGPQGLQGFQGAQGFQGPQGWQGVQGVQGWQGFQGVQGTQGWQGFQGPQGWQGFQGNNTAGGSPPQVQYNLAGVLAGTQMLTIDTDKLPVNTSWVGPAPAVNAAGAKEFASNRAGRTMMSQVMPDSTQYYTYQPGLFSTKVFLWSAQGNGTNISTIGFGASNTGTATARTVTAPTGASTDLVDSTRRLGFVSGATAGNSAGTRNAALMFSLGTPTFPSVGGFYYVVRFNMVNAAATTTQRAFIGLITNAAAINSNPSGAVSTCNPSQIGQMVGFGVDATDSSWFFMHNGNVTSAVFTASSTNAGVLTVSAIASGTIAVGQPLVNANFTAPGIFITANISGSGVGSTWQLSWTAGAAIASSTFTQYQIGKDALTGTLPPRDNGVTLFEARIYSPRGSSTVSYSLQVLNAGGSLAEGSTSTNVPDAGMLLSPQIWTNNGGTAAAVGIDVVTQYIETDF